MLVLIFCILVEAKTFVALIHGHPVYIKNENTTGFLSRYNKEFANVLTNPVFDFVFL